MSSEAGSVCPADGKPLDPVPRSSPEDVRRAVEAARDAQASWVKLPLKAREAHARRLAYRLMERRGEGIAVMKQETGRSATDSLMSEIAGASSFADLAIRTARTALAPERVRVPKLDYPGKRATIEAVPRGVIGIIAPWNYPVGNFFKSLFPALLSGNAVVLKPSEHTPRSGAWLAQICAEAFPPGLVQLAQGDGAVGSLLLESGIDGLVFTGSVNTGRKVSAAAAQKLIPCSVELGGKDAAIVLRDCALDRTVAGIAFWGTHNAGQDCSSIERVYVEAAIAGPFVDRLTGCVGSLRVAAGNKEGDIGPLQNAAQLDIVRTHVEDAKAKGAVVRVGGEPTGVGYGFQPTVLDHCTDDMLITRDETFGPVLPIIRVQDAEEAVRRANDAHYGLNGSVWTKDLARGEALARRLEVGVALVNNHSLTGIWPQTPWTGVKDTGPGVASSRFAYHTFVRRRTVVVDKNTHPDPWWFPANDDLRAFGEALIDRGLGSMGALVRLMGLFKRRVAAIKALAGGGK